MCNKALKTCPWSLVYVPNWFVAHYYHDDELITQRDGYEKRKAQKVKIKKELLPIAWDPDRVMGWCMSEYEERWWK